MRNAWAIISGRTNWVLARAKRARANAVVEWAERRVESISSIKNPKLGRYNEERVLVVEEVEYKE